MTIFTIVSIVIALCGATYTAIAQFASALDVFVTNRSAQTIQSVKTVEELAEVGTKPVLWSKIRLWCAGTAKRGWDYSIFPPVIALLIFSFSIGYEMLDTIGRSDADGPPNPGRVEHYHCWLEFVFWVNAASIAVKILSLVAIWFFAWRQRACQETLQAAKKPKSNITPENPIDRSSPGPT